jgi:hypothetical protein
MKPSLENFMFGKNPADPGIAEQLRNNGFEVIANGPDGMKKRIGDEVPKWRDIVAKAGIKPV